MADHLFDRLRFSYNSITVGTSIWFKTSFENVRGHCKMFSMRQCGVPYTYGPNGISTYIWTWPMALVSPLKIEKVFGVDQRDAWVNSHFVFRACSNTSFHRVCFQNSKHTHIGFGIVFGLACVIVFLMSRTLDCES